MFQRVTKFDILILMVNILEYRNSCDCLIHYNYKKLTECWFYYPTFECKMKKMSPKEVVISMVGNMLMTGLIIRWKLYIILFYDILLKFKTDAITLQNFAINRKTNANLFSEIIFLKVNILQNLFSVKLASANLSTKRPAQYQI